MAAASAGVLVSTGTQPIKYQRPLEELDVDMPLLTRRHHLGKEGWSPQARKKKKKSCLKSPKLTALSTVLSTLKWFLFLLEEKMRLEAEAAGGERLAEL